MSRLTNWARAALVERWEADVQEARKASPGPAPTLTGTARRGFEIGIPVGGLNETNSTADSGGAENRQSLMTDLYDVFLACPWSWASVNAIAKTITGGGISFEWTGNDEDGDEDAPPKPRQVLECERLLKWVNPREDMIQLLRSVIADLLVFGDAYIELVWAGGIPVAMYSLDCPSTTPTADTHGNITGYVQVTPEGSKARFAPHEVIHISLDAPRSGVFGVSPTFAAQLPIKVWLFTMATLQELFRKGLPPNIHVDHPSSMSATDQQKWVEQHMTRNVGARNIGRPLVTKGGATVNELQPSRIEEILHTLDQQRDIIVAAYGVPPAEAGIIESGNLGGGTGEAQRKSFLINTCQPIAALVLEKLNYVLLDAFGIADWALRFNEVDMRDSEIVEKIRDMRIRNGLWTLNKARTDISEPPVDGGDAAILVDRQGAIPWRDMDTYGKANIAKVLQGTMLEPNDPGDANTPLTLKKTEPQPVPEALQAFAGKNNAPKPGEPADGETEPAGGAAEPTGPAKPEKGAAPAPPNVAKAKGGKGKPTTESRQRPVRESWATYRARIRRALTELPEEPSDRTAA